MTRSSWRDDVLFGGQHGFRLQRVIAWLRQRQRGLYVYLAARAIVVAPLRNERALRRSPRMRYRLPANAGAPATICVS